MYDRKKKKGPVAKGASPAPESRPQTPPPAPEPTKIETPAEPDGEQDDWEASSEDEAPAAEEKKDDVKSDWDASSGDEEAAPPPPKPAAPVEKKKAAKPEKKATAKPVVEAKGAPAKATPAAGQAFSLTTIASPLTACTKHQLNPRTWKRLLNLSRDRNQRRNLALVLDPALERTRTKTLIQTTPQMKNLTKSSHKLSVLPRNERLKRQRDERSDVC